MTVAPRTDGRERLRALLTSALDGPRLDALLDALAGEVREADDALVALSVAIRLSDATGARLDRIGAMLGEQRGGLADSRYRAILRASIAAHRSDGTLRDIGAVLALLADPGRPSSVRARPPLTVEGAIVVDALPDDALAARLGRLIRRSLAATVGGMFAAGLPDALTLDDPFRALDGAPLARSLE